MAIDDTLFEPLFDPEVNRTIHDSLPEIVVTILALVTRLGDGATLVAIAILLYWFGTQEDRETRALVLAIAVTTLALVAGMKGILEIQRPLYVADPPFGFAPESYGGWSTPSAHAMGAAAVYGSLAVVIDVGTRFQRYLVAGVLITAVALSRVVIGVHYVGDVILGVVLGFMLVVVGLRLSRKSVTPMFGFSLIVAIIAFLLGSTEFTTMAIGASAGGLLLWWYVEEMEANPTGTAISLIGIGILAVLGIVRAGEALIVIEGGFVIADTVSVGLQSIIETVGYAIAFGGAIAMPFVADRLDEVPTIQLVHALSPFRGREVDLEAVGEEPFAKDRQEF